MNNRERTNAILHYESYDAMPVVAFGYWNETLDKWAREGYIAREDAELYAREGDLSAADRRVMDELGFDFNWNSVFGGSVRLLPAFEPEVLRTEPDGAQIVRDGNGLIVRVHPGISSIPSDIGTSLTGREAWESLYLPRLQDAPERVNAAALLRLKEEEPTRSEPVGVHLGSLYGAVRDFLGVQELSYLAVDDPDLYLEVIDTLAGLAFRVAERIFSYGVRFDYAHFWEDICFRNGPLIRPEVFRSAVGPHYRKLTDLAAKNGIDIVSVDCDGCIDKLVPIWLENGVNTMFPIEVGVWNASIAPWRKAYGRALRGVGGMDKRVFAADRAAVDAEIERLKALVDLGGYIPCPDHRIPPDADFRLVQYYCSRFRKEIR